MRIINLTACRVTLSGENGAVSVPPSGTVARLQTQSLYDGHLCVGPVVMPVTRPRVVGVEGLPPMEAGTCYLVDKQVVMGMLEPRSDVFGLELVPGQIKFSAAGLEATVTRLLWA